MENSQTHKAFMCFSSQALLIHKPLISLKCVEFSMCDQCYQLQ